MNMKKMARIGGDVLGSAIIPKDLADYGMLALALGGAALDPEIAKAAATAYAVYAPFRSAMYLARRYGNM